MLPVIKHTIRKNEKAVKSFGGINESESYIFGELQNCENIVSNDYPSLSARDKRRLLFLSDRTINGIGYYEQFFYTSYSQSDEKIYLTIGNCDYEFTDYSDHDDFSAKRSFASLSDSILIIPDKVIFYPESGTFSEICVNESYTDSGAEEKFASETNNSSIANNFSSWHIGSLTSDALHIRTMNYLLNYVPYTFCYMNFTKVLKPGDVVTIKINADPQDATVDDAYREYVKKMKNGFSIKIKDIETQTHTTPLGDLDEVVKLVFDTDSIDMGGYSAVWIDEMSVERTMPDFDGICSFNNRIWGYSGKNVYASALGRASEFNDFSVDSYGTLPSSSFSTTAQTDGNFTGIIPYGNFIYAFKENTIHKIYGDSPDEYTMYTIDANGIGKTMKNAVSRAGSSLIYASNDGIYMINGGYPVKISQKLKDGFTPVCMASDTERCFILCNENSKKIIYVYDTKKAMWHKQNADTDCTILFSDSSNICMSGSNKIVILDGILGDDLCEKSIRWKFTLKYDEKLANKNTFGKAEIRFSLGKDAYFTVRAHYDNDLCGNVCGAHFDEVKYGGKTVTVPLKRCHSFSLEFCGTGKFSLKSINLKFYKGSTI